MGVVLVVVDVDTVVVVLVDAGRVVVETSVVVLVVVVDTVVVELVDAGRVVVETSVVLVDVVAIVLLVVGADVVVVTWGTVVVVIAWQWHCAVQALSAPQPLEPSHSSSLPRSRMPSPQVERIAVNRAGLCFFARTVPVMVLQPGAITARSRTR
jgi:hypothetical protein